MENENEVVYPEVDISNIDPIIELRPPRPSPERHTTQPWYNEDVEHRPELRFYMGEEILGSGYRPGYSGTGYRPDYYRYPVSSDREETQESGDRKGHGSTHAGHKSTEVTRTLASTRSKRKNAGQRFKAKGDAQPEDKKRPARPARRVPSKGEKVKGARVTKSKPKSKTKTRKLTMTSDVRAAASDTSRAIARMSRLTARTSRLTARTSHLIDRMTDSIIGSMNRAYELADMFRGFLDENADSFERSEVEEARNDLDKALLPWEQAEVEESMGLLAEALQSPGRRAEDDGYDGGDDGEAEGEEEAEIEE